VIGYKFLLADDTTHFTGFRWPLPGRDSPGAWVQAAADPCRSGVHACRPADLPCWAGEVLYEVELDGDINAAPGKLVASRGRLLRRIPAWDSGVRDAFTRDCADRAHRLAVTATPALPEWDALVEPSVPEGPALLGFIAARISEQAHGGPQGYRLERARQAAWLIAHLGLTG
jgi:hypothetical protein